MQDHVQSLGQKYMGIRPNNHIDHMFQDTSIKPDAGKGHNVPVSNFLNAQCMFNDFPHQLQGMSS